MRWSRCTLLPTASLAVHAADLLDPDCVSAFQNTCATQALLDAPHEGLDDILSRLLAERKVHRDKEHNLYLREEQ